VLEQALVSFNSTNAGEFTTLPFAFSNGGRLSFTAQRGSFDAAIQSSSSIEIRSHDGAFSFIAL
jgi:hypothetical protein